MHGRGNNTLKHLLGRDSLRFPPREAVAVFDCDGTLIRGDIGEAMLYYQVEHFLFRVSPAAVWPDHPERNRLGELYETLIRMPPGDRNRARHFSRFAHMILSWYFDQLAQGKTEKACTDIVRLCAGFSPSEVRAIAEATASEEMHSSFEEKKVGGFLVPKGIRFIRESLALLRSLHKAGFTICIVSGSSRWSVEAVLRHGHVPSHCVIGIDLVEIDHVLSSTARKPVPVLGGKVRALRERFPARPPIVVSDSVYDLALFRHAKDVKILVRSNSGPADEFFNAAHIRRDDSWFVIDHPTLLS